MHNLPEPFCHLSFYLMPISHESSHYRFQSNLFPLWTAAVHIKEKKKSKNCTTILSLPNLLRTFNWKGEMATAERQYAYIKKTTTTTGKQNWEITVHYFRYLNCFLKKANLIFLPQVKRKDEVYLFPTFDPLKQLLTESWQNTNFISLAHNTA